MVDRFRDPDLDYAWSTPPRGGNPSAKELRKAEQAMQDSVEFERRLGMRIDGDPQ